MSNGRRKRMVVVGFVAVVVGTCAGLSLVPSQSDTPLVTYIAVTPPKPQYSTSKRLPVVGPPIQHEASALPIDETAEEDPKAVAFETWRVAFFQELEAAALYCGGTPFTSTCDGRVCVHDGGSSGALPQLRMWARRPQQLLEKAMVEILGAPPEVDQCGYTVAQLRKGNTLIHAKLDHGGICLGFAPSESMDEDVPGHTFDDHKQWAAGLCDTMQWPSRP